MLQKLFSQLKQMFRTPDIRRRVLFTFLMLALFRLLSTIPLPGINGEAFHQFFGNNPFGNVFTMVTGGRLDNPSIVAIGLGSYINASIIVQLLATVIPKLEELQKEGERGQQLLNQYTRYLTVPLSILQSFVIYTILKKQFPELVGQPSIWEIVTMILSLTAGTILLMWISELITESGVGNGSSVIIFAGILSVLPGLLKSDIKILESETNLFLILMGVLVLMILGIVFITEAVRKIPIQYARRVRGGKTYSAQSSYLPLKINTAGVMPVIFAASLLTFPQLISQFLISSAAATSKLFIFAQKINLLYSQKYIWLYSGLYFVCIVAFTFFYTFVVMKPKNTAENLQKGGGFIPGIRPGTSTEKHITNVVIRLTVVGAIFLATVALLPSIGNKETQLNIFSGIGGTSILIVVGVILDIVRQLKSMVVTRSYELYK